MSDFYNQALTFAKKHIAPESTRTDSEKTFPAESFKAMGQAGYFKLIIPKELGGLGLGIVEHQEAVMAFAQENPSAGLCYMMHNVALNCVLNGPAPDETKKAICKDIVENNAFMALAYSEVGTGTHFYVSQVKVSKNGENTVLNGTKSMVTSAEYASYYLVLANSIEKEGAVNNWIIPLNTKGLSFMPDSWNGMGMRGNVSAPMKMTDVELSPSMRIGAEGSGMQQVSELVSPMFIIGLASVYSAIALRQSEMAIKYSKSRVYPQTGKSLSTIETVQIHLAKIYTMALSSATVTHDAAQCAARGDADALAKILAARINASENAIAASNLAMRVGGGKTYNKGTQIERFLRDSYGGQIMAPSVDVLIVWLGRALTDQSLF